MPRPSQRPADHGERPPAAATRAAARCRVAGRAGNGHRGERGAGPAEEQHRDTQEVAEAHQPSASAASTCTKPSTPSTTRSARSTIAAGPLVRAHSDLDRRLQGARRGERVQGVEGVEVGGVVAAVEGRPHAAALDQVAHRPALVERHRRANLQHLAAPVRGQAGRLRLLGDALEARERGVLVRHAAPVERRDRSLVLDAHAQLAQLRRVALGHEALDPPLPAREGRDQPRPLGARVEQLGAVGADVGDAARPPRAGAPRPRSGPRRRQRSGSAAPGGPAAARPPRARGPRRRV